MQVTSPGAAAVWDTPTIEPIIPSSVDAYDPGNPDNGGTLDSPPQQQDSNAGYYDTAEPQPLQQGPAPGFEILYTKPLLVDPATGEALEVMHTKPLQISLDGSGPVDYGVNKPLQIDGAPHLDIGYNKPLLMDPATGESAELVHTKPLQIAPESAMQAASPDAATAVAAPKASAMEIAALELLLAEPANQEMIAQFGPPLAPLNIGTDVGSGIQARFGTDLGARLTQLQEAQNNVRGQFLKALDEAQQHPGPNVAGSELIERHENWRDGDVTEKSLYTVTYPPSASQESDLKAIDERLKFGMSGRTGTDWRFTDPAEFAKAYAAGDSPAQKAFASLHGKEPLQFHEAEEYGGGDAGPFINPAYYTLGESKLVAGGQTVDDNGNPGGWRDATLEKTQLTPEQNRRLINNEYLWFDPVNGWSTDLENNIRPSNSFIDKAFPLVFAGVMTMMTAGAFGITAASASTSLGQSMALGAISSANMQLATGGKINLGNMLRSALTAGVTFGVTKFTGLGNLLSSTDTATRTLGHLGKAGLQGLLQEASGGKFKDGLTNSLISSVAGEVGKSLDSHIADLSDKGQLNVQEASTLRLMSRAASSVVRVAGSGDAAAGFASDFLGGLMEEANPFAGKADAGGKADKANKPDNEWVQSLGASDVDPTQAQGLKPGGSLQGLRVSGDALSGWGDGIGGAGHGQSRDGLGNALGGSLLDDASNLDGPAEGALSSAQESFRKDEIQEQNWNARTQNALALAGPGRWEDDMPLSAADQYVQNSGGEVLNLAVRSDTLTGPSYNGVSANAGQGTSDDPRVSGDLEVRESAETMLPEDLRRFELEYRNRNEQIEPTTGSALADEAIQRAAGTVLGVASIVHGGAQLATDQMWAIGNAVSGGWLANNVPAAQAATDRNIELGNSLLNLPGQLSRGALRAVTGNWYGAAQDASNALQLNEIQAANARGDYLSAQVMTTQAGINVAGLAMGGVGAARAGLELAAVQNVRNGAQLAAQKAAENLSAPRQLNSQFGGLRIGSAEIGSSRGTEGLPVPRVDVSDRFEIKPYNGVMDIDYLDAENGTHGLNAYLDRNGRLSFEVRAQGDASTHGSGTDMFASLMKRLSKQNIQVNGITGTWVSGTDSVNAAQFSRNVAAGMTAEQAALNTWTGKLASRYGYTTVSVPDPIGGVQFAHFKKPLKP